MIVQFNSAALCLFLDINCTTAYIGSLVSREHDFALCYVIGG